MKKYNRYNFFKHTFCEWHEVPSSYVEGRKPDYKSDSGSLYYFDQKGVARYANHWGRAANCRWRLSSSQSKSNVYSLAYASWDSFFPNNENEALYAIVYIEAEKQVTFKHKGELANTEHVYRTASETAKRITKIREILETEAWFKYIEGYSLDEARDYFLKGLMNSNDTFHKLRQKMFEK